ncbi:ribosomal RNA-processing 15-like [Lecanosticta acicola]|uniref:Ribosomal RNA-processing 15-like n=1 Tax=Lecanosticta acicola TaxID=111012 RepID=A0AAI9EC71_9PEZI|nr:ribosomal RNA-processing 15-like [Lecanosticta acicola]
MAPAPAGTKRRRVEDEVRPKNKAKKHFKKQKKYHSSSEDEEDEPAGKLQRASDVPRPTKDASRIQPKFSMKASMPAGKAKATSRTTPKSILKQSEPVAEAAESSADDSDDEEDDLEVDELEKNTALNALQNEDSEDEDSEEDEEENDEPNLDSTSDNDDDDAAASDSPTSSQPSTTTSSKKKRNDPTAFATSIQKLLSTKLTTSKRSDPVLSRSKSAAEANKTLTDQKLEQKARAQIRAEKKQVSERGRVKDVLGLQTPDVDTGAVMEEEKRLKKTAQRGVVRLFNAVRAAQVKAEEARKEARKEGIVGMQKREEKVNEMSKQGFLDLISSGGKGTAAA